MSEERKMPSTIRVLSDVMDVSVSTGKIDARLREILSASSANEPTESEAQELVTMLGSAVERLVAIQRDLTMGVKE